MTTRVIDEGDLRKYRTELPNTLDDSDLSVYAFRLYAHLKRRAGDNGKCFEGARGMAEHCKMSPASVVNAKKELAEKGFIVIEPGDKTRSIPDTIRVVNIWEQNFLTYQTPCSPNKQPCSIDEHPVHEPAESRSPNEHPVHETAQKKEPTKKELKKERTEEKAAGEKPPAPDATRVYKTEFTIRTYLEHLKTLPAFDHIDVRVEESLIKLWHEKPRNANRKITKQFLENWVKRTERPLEAEKQSEPVKPSKREQTQDEIEEMVKLVVDRIAHGESIEQIAPQLSETLTQYDVRKVLSLATSQLPPEKTKPPPAPAQVVELSSQMQMPRH